MKKNYKKVAKMTNAIDSATTTSKDWGFAPVPCKGGKTTNAVIGNVKPVKKTEEETV